jgi:hypothetical protein
MIEYTVKVYDVGTFWYLDGKRHREDGPAVETTFGNKIWYLNGKLHREDGPAIEKTDGAKHWFLNGKYHREDGPANEYADGTKAWWIHGKRLTKEKHRLQLQNSNWLGSRSPGMQSPMIRIEGKNYKLTEVKDD